MNECLIDTPQVLKGGYRSVYDFSHWQFLDDCIIGGVLYVLACPYSLNDKALYKWIPRHCFVGFVYPD